MLPHSDWLPRARALTIGMRTRIRHGREARANLIVANERDRWWGYCQKCKDGGVVSKEHVLLEAPVMHTKELTLPQDMVPVETSEYLNIIGAFLARKNMMFPYLPAMQFSYQQRRLLLQDDAGRWHGRDVTERSDRKWMNYNHAKFVGVSSKITVITEDLFSMYKARYALRDWHRDLAVCCTLGAGIHGHAALALKDCSIVVWAYDADKAGDAGYAEGSKRMRAFGPTQFRARPPEGLDPKDMDCQSIRDMIGGCLGW